MMHVLNHIFFRFDATPLSGQSKGLLLVLDGHNDLVAASTVPDYFQVLGKEKLLIKSLKIYTMDWLQGMEALVDTKNEYPITSRKKILLKPGHLVRQK